MNHPSDIIITDGCYPLGEPGLLDYLMVAVIPVAIGFTLWRIFRIFRAGPGRTTILGLDENSTTYREAYDHGISWQRMFLYGLTGVVFGFEVFRSLVDLLLA